MLHPLSSNNTDLLPSTIPNNSLPRHSSIQITRSHQTMCFQSLFSKYKRYFPSLQNKHLVTSLNMTIHGYNTKLSALCHEKLGVLHRSPQFNFKSLRRNLLS